LKRQLFQAIFWHGYHPYVCVFSALYLLQEGGGELIYSDGGGDPYSLFLKVPWVYMALASSDFTFRTKKAAGAKIGEQGRFGVILIPFATR
jgi:hypothetical protein